ncbi:L-histidine N(alpha)-methyltransferase [Acidisphaera sp. L21]|uniref:L-histidine N(alpha)-methyltransferase n=1 Tax=Acidisphaera sp. L21 TaxID=1641851 RepID=UPI00131BDA32|nr:L-histidine N(alpha)-methyltransferase [Acidisphaera sp. L21]
MPDGYNAPAASIVEEVLMGLSQPQKTLPAKFFYDAEGCRLFGKITRLPEYYVTRTEQALLQQVAPELPRMPGCALVEYGASDESKAMMLLDHIGASAYVPVDIADSALQDLTQRLHTARPSLSVHPVAADFLRPLALPHQTSSQQRFGFFPGSTIGNLDHATAHRFLVQVRETLGANARFLVGADLRKDSSILIPAYDDAQGVTAAFNLNLLSHLNREIGTDFELENFSHRAVWNDSEGRIEMHLVCAHRQTVSVGGTTIVFDGGETIHTENSYKHTVPQLRSMAERAGWRSEKVWTDPAELFSIHLLAADDVVN